MNYMVKVSNLALTYQTSEGETQAIENISFKINEGEFVGIIGPSGCGKSTMLSIIAGLLKPTRGSVELPYGKGSIGYMLQKDSLFPWRTIRQNVLLGPEINKTVKESSDYADELLKTYGLWDFKNSFPAALSGGMRQRAALIRTLVMRPKLLLLDEAFSALDYQTRLAVSDDIHSIIKKENKTAIMVTHDISEAVSMADRVIVLTRRPARIRSVYDIKWEEGADTPLKRREQDVFRSYFNKIWRDIDAHI